MERRSRSWNAWRCFMWPTRTELRVALLAYAGPMPCLVVPMDLPPAPARIDSSMPSTVLWKSNSSVARSDSLSRPAHVMPAGSSGASSLNRLGRWITVPLPSRFCVCG